MKLYPYVVMLVTGFAPNPFFVNKSEAGGALPETRGGAASDGCYRWRKSLNVNATGVLVIPPAVAVICVVPADKPVAKPLLSIVATFGELLAQ
jgi:hypothetical protein